ncbi:MAG: hypothetical protein H7A23_19505 [Leptospiraceae bacterium]|nr:hypothetical protein [Leptospiraceae bacterium]
MYKVLLIVLLLPSVMLAQSGKKTPPSKAKKPDTKKTEPVKKEEDENLIGLQFHYFGNGTPAGKVNGAAAGGGFQFEPDFLNISDSMRLGYILEYTRSTSRPGSMTDADYKMVNNILYLQYRYKISSMLDFYGNFGVGVSYINFKRRRGVWFDSAHHAEGADPMFMTEIGWQGLKFAGFVVRVGLRGNAIVEKYIGYGNGGLQLSVLKSF